MISHIQAELWLIFWQHLPVFVIIATRVGLAKIGMTPCDRLTPKTPSWCKIPGPILNVSWVVVICVWKFPNFRYHGNRGWSDTNHTYTVKSADPENPYLAQESWWYLIYKLSCSRFSVQMSNFCYRGNKGGSSKILNDSLWLAHPENPQFGAKFWDLS